MFTEKFTKMVMVTGEENLRVILLSHVIGLQERPTPRVRKYLEQNR